MNGPPPSAFGICLMRTGADYLCSIAIQPAFLKWN